MPDLELEGLGTVEVDDDFLSLSQQDQQKAVDEIASTLRAGKGGEGADSSPISMLDLTRSFIGQGVMFGFGDEAEAAARTAYERFAAGDNRPLDVIYDETLKGVRGDLDKFAEEHPVASTVAELSGAVAPIALTRGRAAPTSFGRATRRAAGESAAGGAAYGVGTGEGAADRATKGIVGGAVGGLVGAAMPGVIEGVKLAAQPAKALWRAFTRSDDEAARRVATSISDDQARGGQALTDQQILDARRAGQPVTNAESGGEVTRALARNAANQSPEARDTMNVAVNARFEGMGERITNKLQSLVGGAWVTDTREGLKTAAAKANRPRYDRAYDLGDFPIASDEINRLAGSQLISTAIKRVIQGRGRDRAIAEGKGAFNPPFTVTQDGRVVASKNPRTGMPAYPNLQFWDYVKREADDIVGQMKAKNADISSETQILKQFRDELDNLTIDPRTGKSAYAEARTGALKFFEADDALTAGEDFISKQVDWREAQKAFNALNPAEKQLFAEGFSSKLIQSIEQTRDRVNVVNRIYGSKDARNRIRIALGPQKADELEAFLRIESGMDLLRPALQGNSKTAQYLTEAIGIGIGYQAYSGGSITDPMGFLVGALYYGGRRGGARIAAAAEDNVNKRVAQMLMSDDPTVYITGVQRLARNPQAMARLRQVSAVLGTLSGRGGAAIVGAEGE